MVEGVLGELELEGMTVAPMKADEVSRQERAEEALVSSTEEIFGDECREEDAQTKVEPNKDVPR